MENITEEIKDIKDISTFLTRENKKYVIAVANALLFSQNNNEQSYKSQKQTKKSHDTTGENTENSNMLQEENGQMKMVI